MAEDESLRFTLVINNGDLRQHITAVRWQMMPHQITKTL